MATGSTARCIEVTFKAEQTTSLTLRCCKYPSIFAERPRRPHVHNLHGLRQAVLQGGQRSDQAGGGGGGEGDGDGDIGSDGDDDDGNGVYDH